MNRRQWMILSGAAAVNPRELARAQQARAPGDESQTLPGKLLLKDFRPRSLYKIPKTEITKAKYPVVDAHYHAEWVKSPEDLDEMVKLMDEAGVEKTVTFVRTGSPDKYSELSKRFSKYPERFDLWCGFDLKGCDEPGFGPAAVKSLEECHRLGAVGVGEIGDKGTGIWGAPKGSGLHPDDARMDPLYDQCARLGMPINMHVSDPIWAYEPMDNTNDGLMNCYTWRITVGPGVLGHNELIECLERAVAKHPRTTFIACHIANLEYDLTRLGQMLDRNPNLYVDVAARFGEMSPIARAAGQFIQRYPDRVLYGTDMAYTRPMFRITFRILESHDEHFYGWEMGLDGASGGFSYHWPLYGLGLPDEILKKVYGDNARKVFKMARANAA
ncbi:MAG: amidohydrolase family protein [Terriglobia bacterium]